VYQCRLSIRADIAGKPMHVCIDKTELLPKISRSAFQPEIDKVNLQMRMICVLFVWEVTGVGTNMNYRNIAVDRHCLTMSLDKIPKEGIMTSGINAAKPNDLPHDTVCFSSKIIIE
jgi:hypothetical protein